MHQARNKWTMCAILAAALVIPGTISAQSAGDNSKVNTRDRDSSAPTADQQKENTHDREVTQNIRRAIMKNKTLSSYAHNVKIITQGGQVTLKGPVRTEDEKRVVEAKAIEVAGTGHVTNEISVTPKGSK
jgi:hyperosmotically inducible protein